MARLTMAFAKPVQEKQGPVATVTKREKKANVFSRISEFFRKLFVGVEPPKDKKQAVSSTPSQVDTTVSLMIKKNADKPILVATTGVPDNVSAPGKKVCKNGDPMYTYDPLDRVTSMTSPAGTTNYHYDTTTGRLDKITSPEGKEFNYSYNHGQLSTLAYPNGITAHYAFDDNGNLIDLDYRKGGSTVRSYGYAYDKNGMRTSMTDVDGTHNYSYDSLYQIVQATHPTAPNPLEQFSYDAVGNRLSDNVKSAYQYNELNQLTEDDSCTYAYDLDGNMAAKIEKATSDTTVYTYDIENKLMQVQKPGMLAQYVYDALGRRMAKTVNGVSKHFRYDRDNLILEMNGSDSVTADYTFGTGIDNPLSMHRNGNNYFYVRDGLGSVTALTDDAGNVKHEYKYSVFGKIVDESGDTVENHFTYTSRERDQEAENYYYRARCYNPQTGRFLQEDPIGFKAADVNFYRYASNSPVIANDPSGTIIKVCTRKSRQWLLNALDFNHAYFWNTKTKKSCGKGDPNYQEQGPDVDACTDIPGSDGKEDQIMKCCKDQKPGWFPGTNDCFNLTEDCTKAAGCSYPGAPGGRHGPCSPPPPGGGGSSCSTQ
jgi:RHS repeat-associated protein